MKTLTYTLMLLLVIACVKQEQQIADNVGTIQFKFDGKNPAYDEVFSKTEVIPLETNEDCLINTINQMEVWDGKFFILDWKQNTLLVYSDQGKYLNKIGSIGRGPGEYIRPRYFFIDKEKKLVNIFDAPMKKLMCFRQTGELINEIHLDHYLSTVGKTAKGYWGFCSNVTNVDVDNEASKYVKFMTFNEKGDVEKYVKGGKCIDQICYSNGYATNATKEGVSFVEPFARNIYSMKDGAITVKYKIDYSGRFPSSNILRQIEDMNRPLSARELKLERLFTTQFSSMFVQFYENENWILLFSMLNSTSLFYNKTTRKTHEISKYIASADYWDTYIATGCCLSDNSVYGYANSNNIKWLLENGGKISDKRKKNLKKLFDSMSVDDNPVIVKYDLIN
ncbi:6-bladed beta-propeller [Puteibacter caeruleilacunae]|nr:6-bladed beta-propeller [Puteibacter caeruleilacunae]